MRVNSTFRFLPERNLPRLMVSLPPATEYCTAAARALADVSTFDARLGVALTQRALARMPASLAMLP